MGDYYARFRGGRRVKLPPASLRLPDPTIFSPGASAVKSRLTRSGIDPAVPLFSVRPELHRFSDRPRSQGGTLINL